MGGKFTKPCGAFADLKELEYISALHQTGFGPNTLRPDGSIQAIDIVHFLMSRYGIKVTEDEVEQTIMEAFGERQSRTDANTRKSEVATKECDVEEENAANHDHDNSDNAPANRRKDCLDLAQVLSLLLIPLLLKAEVSLTRSAQAAEVGGCDMNSNIRVLAGEESSPSPTSPKSTSGSQLEESGRLDKTNSYTDIQEQAEVPNSPRYHQRNRSSIPALNHRDKGGKYCPDADVIEIVLETILHDVTGDPSPQPLTKQLLCQILFFYGEGDLATDEFLEDMIRATAPLRGTTQPKESNLTTHTNDISHDTDEVIPEDVEGEPFYLDKHAFARALTHDIKQYNIENEDSLTTNYHDVFKTYKSTKEGDVKNLIANRLMTVEKVDDVDDIRPVQRVFTFPSIDYTADTFRSKGFVVLLWVTWILSYFAYLFDRDGQRLGDLNCDESEPNFGCFILQGLINWSIIMLQLTLIGTPFILWASVGNSVYQTHPLLITFGIISPVVFAILPYFNTFKVIHTEDGDFISTEKVDDARKQMLYNLAFICGTFLVVASSRNLLQRLVGQHDFWKNNKWLRMMMSVPGAIVLESNIKKAASFKVNQLVRNARAIHKIAEYESTEGYETLLSRALLSFEKTSERREDFGGFFSTWKRLFSGKLFSEDGIWFTARLISGNVGQLTLCVFLISFFVNLQRSDFFQNELSKVAESEKWRLMAPLRYGLAVSEITIIIITLNYVPSTTRTVLLFRSGGIPSLHDARFWKLRVAVDQASLLFGTLFWGSLYTAILIGLFSMVFLAIILNKELAPQVLNIFASFLGLVITVILKILVLMIMRRKYHRGYYRTNPAKANLLGIIIESWNLGLTTQYMIIRCLKLLLAATLFIGRVDVPFLTEDANNLGLLEIDHFPLVFRKDVLTHEAHRHPYLERIGVMYMMKLRHSNFGNYVGTIWRLLFIFAMTPWLRKYRSTDDNLDVSNFRYAANRLWTGRMPFSISKKTSFLSSGYRGTPSVLNTADQREDNITELSILRRQQKNMEKEIIRLKEENEILRSTMYSQQ